jgi:hypothetical protein
MDSPEAAIAIREWLTRRLAGFKLSMRCFPYLYTQNFQKRGEREGRSSSFSWQGPDIDCDQMPLLHTARERERAVHEKRGKNKMANWKEGE